MVKEFKAFINQGNVFQTAVGLIMALAFAPIVTSLVNDVIMPVVGRIFGAPDFSALKIGLGGTEDVLDPVTGDVIGKVEPSISYGLFINTIVSFVIIAFVMFMLVKAYNKAFPPKPEEPAGPTEVELLTEIRDNLAARQG